MERTYEETIYEATVQVVNKVLSQTNTVNPKELKSDILNASRNDILLYNSVAQPGTKWKIPTELAPFQVAHILIHMHRVAVIETGAKERNKDKMLLGIYVEDGEDKGIYVTSEPEIRNIARLYKRDVTRKELG